MTGFDEDTDPFPEEESFGEEWINFCHTIQDGSGVINSYSLDWNMMDQVYDQSKTEYWF